MGRVILNRSTVAWLMLGVNGAEGLMRAISLVLIVWVGGGCGCTEYCSRDDQHCMEDCTDWCKLCIAESDEECAETDRCSRSGTCHLVDGVCSATSNADCRKSDGCAASGKCSFLLDGCMVGSDADCGQSQACRMDGSCVLKDTSCQVSEAGCMSSESCAEYGRCHVVNTGSTKECRPMSDADCRNARACRERGYCSFDSTKSLCA